MNQAVQDLGTAFLWESWSKYASHGDCVIFCYAIKLGIRITIETLTKK